MAAAAEKFPKKIKQDKLSPDTLQHSRHHLFFPSEAWASASEYRALHKNRQHTHRMYADRHDALHERVSHVPLIGTQMALRTISALDTLPETTQPLEAIGNLQKALERAIRNRHSDPIDRGLGFVAITALDMQKEFFVPEMPATVIDLHPSSRR